MAKEKIWALLVHLSKHMWSKRYDTLPFDDDFWTYILKESVKAGLNMIVLDIGDGIQFASHPEIAMNGARPWIWSCPLFRHPEEYRAHVGVKDAVISPWYYHAINEENWTPISSWQDYIDYYAKEPYKSMNLTYVEQDPYNTMWRREALPGLKDGFDYIPCASTYYNVDRNTHDIVEYFKTNGPDEQILGYMTAPWATTVPTEYSKHHIDTSLRLMKEAKEKFYG